MNSSARLESCPDAKAHHRRVFRRGTHLVP
jgi:hypothetical protein